jgi:hypothetical protein
MHHRAVEVIGEQRAARAALLPVRAEHEVIDDQLALAAEQIGERLLAVRGVEHVVLVDLLPRQLAPFAAQRITRARERLFVGEMRLAGSKPFIVRDDLVRLHCVSPI